MPVRGDGVEDRETRCGNGGQAALAPLAGPRSGIELRAAGAAGRRVLAVKPGKMSPHEGQRICTSGLRLG